MLYSYTLGTFVCRETDLNLDICSVGILDPTCSRGEYTYTRPIPLPPCRACSCFKLDPKNLTGKNPCSVTFPYSKNNTGTKHCVLHFKICCSGPFFCLFFFGISLVKTKLFWSFHKIKKEYNLWTIADKKIIIIRHQGVKSFWTKVRF